MTTTKYTLDPLDSTTIIVNPESNIDDIFVINPSINKFKFLDGNYYLTNTLFFYHPGIEFVGCNLDSSKVHIFQKNTLSDGLVIKISNILLKHISVHVPHDYKVALTISGNHANSTKVENCHFYGNNNCPTVLYSGPDLKSGENTIIAYDTNHLNCSNVFRKNVVYSNWSGDNITYSLQKNGLFTGNIVRGGKIKIYMCKFCYVTCNSIYNSNTNGIDVSLPSHSLQIKYNKIYESKYSAIKITNQLDYFDHINFNSRSIKHNILIKENYICDTKNSAIEINDVNGLQITNNQLVKTNNFSIQVLNSDDVQIKNNKISYFTKGILSDKSNCIQILNNRFINVYPNIVENIVKFIKTNDCTIKNNKIFGKIFDQLSFVFIDSIDVTIFDNNFKEWYEEEFDVIK